ncbi:MAG: hypothetical protein PHX83_04050 [Acidobacteriia bacterium]|nr:hypothetical protein [Terriglobia bacterium]
MRTKFWGLSVLCCIVALPGLLVAGYKVKPFSASHASVFPARDMHDRITVAADAYSQSDRILQVFDRDTSRWNILPVLVVFSNDGDDEVEVNGDAIELTHARMGSLRSLPAGDVVQEIFYGRSKHSQSPRVGVRIQTGNPAKDFENARMDFMSKEFGRKLVAPHSTAYGFVFYEVPQAERYVLGAKVYIPETRVTRSPDPKRVGHDLLFFEVELKENKGAPEVR